MKRKYNKPEVKKVHLAPEDAVLAGCKTTLTGKGGSNKCVEKAVQIECRAVDLRAVWRKLSNDEKARVQAGDWRACCLC